MALKLLLCLFLVSAVHGFGYLRGRIPNGYNVKVNGVTWAAVGHTNNRDPDTGNLNSFGRAFQSAGFQWTVALCEVDSDGDGINNGEELGDPDCTWTRGGIPARTSDISSPGDANSKPTSTVNNNNNSTQPTAAPIPPKPDNSTIVPPGGCVNGSCSNSESNSNSNSNSESNSKSSSNSESNSNSSSNSESNSNSSSNSESSDSD